MNETHFDSAAGIRILRCERGPEPSRMPTRGEWEAHYIIIFALLPSSEWGRMFKENMRSETLDGDWVNLSCGDIRGEAFSFFCHPDRLQRNADKLKEIVAASNRDFRDRLAAGDKTDDRRCAFEETADAALRALEI